jgi:hypothetical protein
MSNTDISELLNSPQFSSLSNEQKQFYRTTFERIKGKGFAESALIITDAMKTMPKNGPEPTKQEKALMINAFLDTLPPDQKAQFQKMASMLGII